MGGRKIGRGDLEGGGRGLLGGGLGKIPATDFRRGVKVDGPRKQWSVASGQWPDELVRRGFF